MKRCTSCGQEKPTSEFYVHGETADGLFSRCKTCFAAEQARRVERNRQKWEDADPYTSHKTGTKRCGGCKQALDVHLFGASLDRGDGLHPLCKECKRAESSEWRQSNADIVKKYSEEYKKRNRLAIERRASQYRQKHPERYRAMNAVWSAILTGKLTKANEHKCANPQCDQVASEYHHFSYAQKHWLDVIPLCASCHRKVGAGTLLV